MSERPNEKQVSFFIDEKERQQFQELCKTTGVSASNVLRMWVQSALQAQVINIETPPDGKTVIVSEARGSEPEALGLEVADALIAKGAAEILKAARS